MEKRLKSVLGKRVKLSIQIKKIMKQEFEKNLALWLSKYLENKYSDEFNIEVIKPETYLSKLSNEKIKKVDSYTSFDFKPDLLGVLENKNSKKVELVLLNRSVSAVSLKDIGEINLYSKVVGAKESFVASLKGFPEEVNLILLNQHLENKLLNYDDKKFICLFRFDIKNNQIDKKAFFPLSRKKDF